METRSPDEIRTAVRDRYGAVAEADSGTCCGPSCCGDATATDGSTLADKSAAMGYTTTEIEGVPEGANMGLGCGNPQAIASLRAGETVLDLGAGGGFDCFLAARSVGETGHVIGVDMTPPMVTRARANARQADVSNVEFRLGEIEHLPVADASVDVVISNCVINLSPEKEQVFREAFRVLRPGGRLAVSDIVAVAEIPDAIRENMALYTGCMAGASLVSDLEAMLTRVGFQSVQIRPREESRSMVGSWAPGERLEDYVLSATIEAERPT